MRFYSWLCNIFWGGGSFVGRNEHQNQQTWLRSCHLLSEISWTIDLVSLSLKWGQSLPYQHHSFVGLWGLSESLHDEITPKVVKCYIQVYLNKHRERNFSVIVCPSKCRHKPQKFLGEKPLEIWHKRHSGKLLEKLKLVASLVDVAEIFLFCFLLSLSRIFCFLLNLRKLSKRLRIVQKGEHGSSSFAWIAGSGDFW